MKVSTYIQVKNVKGYFADRLLWDIGLDLLSQKKLIKFRAPGCSMTPFIRDNETIVIKPCRAEELTFGDIILCERPRDQHQNTPSERKLQSSKVIHRFLGRKKIGNQKVLIIKGDANLNYDQPVQPKHVLGKVIAVEKKGWTIRLNTKTGRLLNVLFATISPLSFLIYPSLKFMKPVNSLFTPARHHLSKF